jgi:hypothetical protein
MRHDDVVLRLPLLFGPYSPPHRCHCTSFSGHQGRQRHSLVRSFTRLDLDLFQPAALFPPSAR